MQAKNFQRKLSPQVSGSDGVGKARRVDFKLEIGGHSPINLTGWSKDEMSYSAGSSCSVDVPIKQKGYLLDLMDVSMQHPFLPLRVSTAVWHNDILQHTYLEDFYGLIDTIDLDMNKLTFDVQSKSFAELLLIPKVNEVFSSPAEQAMTTGQAIQAFVSKYGKDTVTGKELIKAEINPRYLPGSPYAIRIGKIFNQQKVRAITNMAPWDLMEDLAKHDNAQLFVKGNVLYYQPAPTNVQNSILISQKYPAQYTFTWGKDILSLKARHSPIAAHDITVNVQTWNRNDKKVYSSTKTMSDAKIASVARLLETDPYNIQEKYPKALDKNRSYQRKFSGSGEVKFANVNPNSKSHYVFKIADATQQDCDDVALKVLEDISQKEFIVTLQVLGSPFYHPQQFIKIAGTNTVLDQVYVIKNIHTEFRMPENAQEAEAAGYITTFTLVNHYVATTGSSIG